MGDKAIKKTPVDIRKVLEDAVAAAQPRWIELTQKQDNPIKIETNLRWVPPIQGDGEQLKTAIYNIILNALDSLSDGGNIRIRNWAGSNFVYIRVTDTGQGMTPEILDKVFEPYFTTRRPIHSGLGLSTSYGIIGKHDGYVRLRSRPGRGTSVTIRLPYE